MYPHLSHDLTFSCHHILSTFQLLLPHTLQIAYGGCALKIIEGNNIYKMSIEKENMNTHIPRTLKSPLMHLLQKCLHIFHPPLQQFYSTQTIQLESRAFLFLTSSTHLHSKHRKTTSPTHKQKNKTFNLQSHPLLKVSLHFPSRSFQ